jgi:hypothetical protein
VSLPYPASGLDDSQISPQDVVVTLRSLPRRFTAALATPDDENRPDDLLHRRPASGGLSAIEHAAWTAQALGRLHDALHQILVHNNPRVSLPPLSPDPATLPTDVESASREEVVNQISAVALALADEVEGVSGQDWTRTGQLNGTTITALDVARGAVQLAIAHLRAASRTVSEVVQERG